MSLEQKLGKLGIQVISMPIDLRESRAEEPSEIAREKVIEAYQKLHMPVVALDAGFFIQALNGFPGTQTNFALKTIGTEGILDLMEKKRDRQCEFRHALAYLDNTLHEPRLFFRTVHGNLAEEPYAESNPGAWSELSRIFVPYGCDNVEAALTPEERSSLSERTSGYYRQFAQWYKAHLGKILDGELQHSA